MNINSKSYIKGLNRINNILRSIYDGFYTVKEIDVVITDCENATIRNLLKKLVELDLVTEINNSNTRSYKSHVKMITDECFRNNFVSERDREPSFTCNAKLVNAYFIRSFSNGKR